MEYFLTIAASDTSGGAGIQQDLKVARDLGYWGLSALSGITVQNFNNVFEIEAVSPSLLQLQIEQCIQSFPVRAIKIGAICSIPNIRAISDCLRNNNVKHIVLDPVLFSTSGKAFLEPSGLKVLKETLFPFAELITPNKPEFEMLTEQKINTIDEGIEIAKVKCKEWNTSILLKGGHFNDAIIKEALVCQTDVKCFKRERKTLKYEHGTGCTLSTALACFLGKNIPLIDSYHLASDYLVKHFIGLQSFFNH